MLRRAFVFVGVALLALLAVMPAAVAQETPAEQDVIQIALSGTAAEADAELSGLAWYGDHLILLAENPNLYASEGNAGTFFALSRDDIESYLLATAYGQEPDPLEPAAIPIQASDIVATIPGFDGFEAIAFNGDQLYAMIEANAEDETMRGFLVGGSIAPDLSAITLDLENAVEIQPQSDINNMSYESLLVAGDQVLTFYEINGAAVNAEPVGYAFDFDLGNQSTLPLDALEFRLTDATTLDDAGDFWVINYFFPGEDFLAAENEPIFEQYGRGESHTTYDAVERLVQLHYAPEGVTIVDAAPIQLHMLGEDARNWEGIARLDDLGLLIVTDKYPETMLAFVPLP